MPESTPEIRIPLPKNPVLRVSAVYGVSALAFLMVFDTVTRALGLPKWIGTVVVLLTLMSLPVVALGAWLWRRLKN